MKRLTLFLFAAVFVTTLSALAFNQAFADPPVAVTLQNHKFIPSQIHVKANVPSMILLTNKDDTAEEFDSTALKVEKVVAGHDTGNVRLRALAPGKYPFMGEYHPGTAQGLVIAE